MLGRALVVATAVNANPVLIFSSSLSSVARREQDFSPAGAGRQRGGVRSRRARGIAAPRLTHTLPRVVWDETTGAASCPPGASPWVFRAQEGIFGVYGVGLHTRWLTPSTRSILGQNLLFQNLLLGGKHLGAPGQGARGIPRSLLSRG